MIILDPSLATAKLVTGESMDRRFELVVRIRVQVLEGDAVETIPEPVAMTRPSQGGDSGGLP